ncbi:hypothetical protein B0P06_000291 [Clostridium saccharoperbutylacetonicum]|uniref:Uncharacterized protein n=1 Tax=Clostridium saccharoperbutylacetonicum N1-4(HMT) TaxID=931276 RepID=M1MLD9_9CLOT|nr:hypothetical protein [Clostridium saccharoperbutylacetonicum]AGF55606.1 hypothetical protein Cspa_c18360 [Clostridium saccharoperbutylacetonicum N1-4(HMT)]NRT63673.1 hypothetical protein [Clostridium saccharoperbutylacetonicum]NSB27036.1 hypothetical protein [Clostridium saccharoperbutylacetonicum]NSB40520.1 hypothetical protein [Clostridium saccharoperbutylacetonicum]
MKCGRLIKQRNSFVNYLNVVKGAEEYVLMKQLIRYYRFIEVVRI